MSARLRYTTVETASDYQFTIPAGVYWVGDPTLMVAAHERRTFTNPYGGPTRFLPDGSPAIVFRTASGEPGTHLGSNGRAYHSPAGLIGLMPPIPGKATPTGASLHAFFEDCDASMVAGQFTIDGELSIPTGGINDPDGPFFTDRTAARADRTALASVTYATRNTRFADLPPGTYWIGDLQPNFTSAAWNAMVASSDGFAGFRGVSDGEPVLVFGAAAGLHEASDGNLFPCTTLLGVMEARRTPPNGGVHTYTFATTTRVLWRDGWFSFGSVTVDTRTQAQPQTWQSTVELVSA